MRKSALVMVAVGAAFAVLLVSSCSEYNPAGVARAYRDAYNSHNISRIMAHLTDDAVLQMDGERFSGKDQLQEMARFDSVLNIELTFTDLRVKGNTVTFKATERNDWLKLAGLQDHQYDPCSMTVQGDLIQEIQVKSTPESMQQSQELFKKLAQWASKDHGQVLDELSKSEYNAESARAWLNLLTQWKAETAQ